VPDFFPSNNFRARLAARALEDENFRRELLENPRAVVERECGLLLGTDARLPEDLRIEVHQESSRVMHLVIPASGLPEEQDNDLFAFWEQILRPGP
jgi:hypothetical protein